MLRDGDWTSCVCQLIATAKWRFEQIKLEPPELKYHNWCDFNGVVEQRSPDGRLEQSGYIEGMDAQTSALIATEARSQAMKYCFDTTDCEAVKNRSFRKKHSVLYKRMLTGSNVIVAGGRKSGRSLLAALILKEVVRASIDSGKLYTFGWIRNTDLLYAATGFDKPIDYRSLEDWAELDFLFIDNFTVPNPKPVCLDKLFCDRRYSQRPTIVTCSDSFLHGCHNEPMKNINPSRVIQMLGEEALSFMTDPSNVVIKLYT